MDECFEDDIFEGFSHPEIFTGRQEVEDETSDQVCNRDWMSWYNCLRKFLEYPGEH